jgi:hypothetical protein
MNMLESQADPSKPPKIPPKIPAPALDPRSITGAQGMSATDLRQAVADGGRFVIFQYCISIIVM